MFYYAGSEWSIYHCVDYYIDLNLPSFWADRHRNEIYVCYLCTLPNANKIVLDMTESLTHLLMVGIKNTQITWS